MTTSERSTIQSPGLGHRVMGGFIGNVVEWYDFAVYGYLAGVIAPVFFPADNPSAALIGTYGIFAAGFLMRPLGAALFGWFGDRHGRARTMQISVVMMALPTLLLGLLPTYASVGLLAPSCSSRCGWCRGSQSAASSPPRRRTLSRQHPRASAGSPAVGRTSAP